jgi:hypothetical protein
MNESIRYTFHALHDLSQAVWFGGNLFGVVALNPGIRAAHSHEERGAVLNQSWENFAPLSLASAITIGATWAGIRMFDPRATTPEMRMVARARDWLAVGTIASAVVSGVLNRKIAEAVPADRVPVQGGTDPAPETPPEAAKAQIAMRYAAAANLIIGGAMITTGAVLEQQEMDQGFRLNDWLPFARRSPAVEAIKGLAIAEGSRRGLKMIGEGLGLVKPQPTTSWEKFTNRAIPFLKKAAMRAEMLAR